MRKIAFVSDYESRLPSFCVQEIKNAGLELICKPCKNPQELVEFAGDCDVIWYWGLNLAVHPEALDCLPKCKAIMRSGSGLDSMPLEYAKAHGIGVFNTPEAISESVAEHTVALLLSATRHIPFYAQDANNGIWEQEKYNVYHVNGRTLGLIGYGRIGKTVEKLLSGYNLKVLHFDPYSDKSTPLDELLIQSDFVSLNCPLTPETEKLMNKERFNMMKKNSILVNTSRGGVIDEVALLEALDNGIIGVAALDVLSEEPPQKDNPLLNHPKVIITPHNAAFSNDFEKNFWSYSAKKLIEICM